MAPAAESLLLAGSTGLVGRSVLAQALAQARIAHVHALARRVAPAELHHDRLEWLAVDFARLPALPQARWAVCALGTTLKAAGSQAAFRAVDVHAVTAFARAAQAAGVTHFGLVSAMGADPRSAVFYNRTKGEAEAAVRALGFARLVVARPSLLVGDRAAIEQPVRLGERMGLMLSTPLARWIPLRWRPIPAGTVARALLNAVMQDGEALQVLESAELQTVGQP
jgi:uncharacterized protein YbjT (DUF2867 family)